MGSNPVGAKTLALRIFTLRRRNKVQRDFRSSGFFVVRTPLLPIEEFLRWGSEDRSVLRSRLKALILRPEILEALFLASPDLVDSLPVWERDPESKRGQRVERALTRYFSRMVVRATSFGLFAGISVGKTGGETKILLAERERYQRNTRLDMNYLTMLSTAIAEQSSLKSSLRYRPNSTLYEAAGRFHYFEERVVEGYRSYHLVAVDPADELRVVLSRAREGARFAELTQELLAAAAPSAAWANEYVEELIETQILVPDFGATITGTDPLRQLIGEFEKHSGRNNAAAVLEHARSQIEALDSTGLGVPIERYQSIVKTLDELTGPIEVNQRFQVDLIKPVLHAEISDCLMDEIVGAVELLERLAPRNTTLDRFRSRFIERYGLSEIPLVEALDEDLGVGFEFSTSPDEQCHSFLLNKVLEAVATGATEIALGANEVQNLAQTHAQKFPLAVAANVELIRNSAAQPDDYWLEIKSVIGPSGANMLGRFCYGDSSLRMLVEQHLRAEEEFRPDAAFAEILYLPENRMANILCRPVLRAFEIPYLGRSAAPPERQLPITDLFLSVSDERIVLRSQSLGCEVLPRLTSAHNFWLEQNLPTYQFLCVLQRQDTTVWSGWLWGPLAALSYLPRLTTGRLILSRACWNLTKDELLSLVQWQRAKRYDAVQQWRVRRRLPRYVALLEDTRELLVDFENVLSIDTFSESIKGNERATLTELFVADSSKLAVSSSEGRFVSDFIIPLVRTTKPEAEETSLATQIRVGNPARKFPPGSEWCLLKLYAGPSSVDRILRTLRPFIESVVAAGTADRWFFLRASDPSSHLRLCFHGNPTTLRIELQEPIQEVAADLLRSGTLWRIQLDTYEREFEKYGGIAGMALAEVVFDADSRAVLPVIDAYHGSTETSPRWFLTLRSIDQLLSDFGLDTSARFKFVSMRLQEKSCREIYTVDFKQRLGVRYRKDGPIVDQLLALSLPQAGQLSEGLLALRQRSERLRQLVTELSAPEMKLLPSFVLTHISRMLQSDHERQQVVMYDYLRRHYGSVLSRGSDAQIKG